MLSAQGPTVSRIEEGLTTAPELAAQLRMDPKELRRLIRLHDLVPDHQHGQRYWLDQQTVDRIMGHPAVRRAARGQAD